jgi:hypothetical protein
VSPAFAGIEWGFDNNVTTVNASGGAGTATMTVGTFGTGWHAVTGPLATRQWSNFGSVPGASGLWDLGSAGSIVLNNLSGTGLTTLNVFQWVQPGGAANNPYNGSLSFAVGGGGLSGTLSPVVPVTGVGWWEYTANLGSAFTSADTVTITASAGGAIIDRLTVVPEPTTLIAGAILLIPFALSALPVLRRMRSSKSLVAGDSDSAASKSEEMGSAPKGRS